MTVFKPIFETLHCFYGNLFRVVCEASSCYCISKYPVLDGVSHHEGLRHMPNGKYQAKAVTGARHWNTSVTCTIGDEIGYHRTCAGHWEWGYWVLKRSITCPDIHMVATINISSHSGPFLWWQHKGVTSALSFFSVAFYSWWHVFLWNTPPSFFTKLQQMYRVRAKQNLTFWMNKSHDISWHLLQRIF